MFFNNLLNSLKIKGLKGSIKGNKPFDNHKGGNFFANVTYNRSTFVLLSVKNSL